jgi:hypothetical protein
MKFRLSIWIVTVTLFGALAAAVELVAQEGQAKEDHHAQHHHYQLIDMGTFGGPSSTFNFQTAALNGHGIAVGASETPAPTPPHFNPFPCAPGSYVYHGFEWRDGAVIDLGALPAG